MAAKDWVRIGSERMAFAKKKLHLTDGDVRDRLVRNGYPMKNYRTYTRWEERGEVPREALPAVATVLGFDLGQILTDQPSLVPWQRVEDVLLEVQETQRVLVTLLGEQRTVVGELARIAAQLDRAAAAIARREAAN